MTLTTIRKLGNARKAFSAHDDAASKRRANKMRRRESGLHAVELGVEWAQPHGACEVLDGGVRLAVPGSQESG
jgi:hypothetical protein